MKRFILVLLIMVFGIVASANAAKDVPVKPSPAIKTTKGAHSYDYTVIHSRPQGNNVIAMVRCVEKDENGKVVETRTVRVTMSAKDFANNDLLVDAADKGWDKPLVPVKPAPTPRVLHYTDN